MSLFPASRTRILALLLVGVLLPACRRAAEAPSAKTAETAAPGPSSPWPKNLDVVLVTIDTLRSDAVGFDGNRRVETPTLDKLASQGIVYDEAHAQNVVTLPSHTNILTGLYPFQHGVRDNSGFKLDPSVPTIATLLHGRGYATGAFVGAFPLDSRFGLTRGFDVYDDRYRRGKSTLDFEMAERPGTEVVAAAREWWGKQAGRPRFLWVHLYDCHAPYRPAAPFAERYADDPYLGEVSGVDAALAPLLEPFLSGAASPALVVVTADHGEARGDHGEETHGLFAYEATLHIPLVVWCRGVLPPSRSSEFVRHVDIAPTILAAVGLEKPAAWPGASLFPPGGAAPPRPSYFESYSTAFNRGWAPLRGMLVDGEKYIDLPIPELYALEEDAAETNNLASKKPEDLRRLARLVPAGSELQAVGRRDTPGSEEVRQLRNLGYLSGGAVLKAKYGPADDPKNLIGIDRRMHDCVDLYQRGKLPEAIAVARDVVRDQPAMPMGYENLAFVLRRAGATDEALAVYRKAVDTGIAGEELLRQYALALSESGRAPEALEQLARLSGSTDPDTLNALGIAQSDAGQGAAAEKTFRRVLSIDPKNIEAWENLGIVQLRADQTAAARDSFEKALSFDGEAARAWNGLGVARLRLGQERPAIDAWKKAVEFDPQMFDALFNLGLVAGKNGLRRESREALERFVAEAPPGQYGPDIAKARNMLRELREAGM
jgi:arylsulfatase A-like enzyme/Flp pilus assembly protein TadD